MSVLVSNALKKRFVKDTGLPIVIFEDKYWDYFLELYDKHYDAKKKWSIFLNTFSYCDSEEERFFKTAENVIQGAIAAVKAVPDYESLTQKNIAFVEEHLPPDKNLYIAENDGKKFISIDLIKANYQALKRYSPKLVFDTHNYEDFIKKFTIYDHFIQSKQIRQVIFGNLNPKKLQILQKKIMVTMLGHLKDGPDGVTDEDVYSLSSDELILYGDNIKQFSNHHVLRRIEENVHRFSARVKPFTLKKLGDYNFYIKEFEDGSIEFKGIPSYFMPQVIKHITGEDLKHQDLLFYFEDMRCRFDEPLVL